MSKINKSAIVPYSAAQMYKLVNDVESYPRFLPWCGGSRVMSRGPHEVWATVEINKGAVRKSFTTRNRLHPYHTITLRLVDGPFQRLEGAWNFDDLDDRGSKVALNLEFDFSSRLLKLLIEPVFHQIANTMVDAFCQRAVEVYGHGG